MGEVGRESSLRKSDDVKSKVGGSPSALAPAGDDSLNVPAFTCCTASTRRTRASTELDRRSVLASLGPLEEVREAGRERGTHPGGGLDRVGELRWMSRRQADDRTVGGPAQSCSATPTPTAVWGSSSTT